MTFAYATVNRFSGLAASAFTFPTGGGPLDASRSYLCDGRMDAQYVFTAYGSTDVIQILFSSPQSLCAIAILNHNLAAIGPGVITITASDDGTTFTAVKAATTLNTSAPKQKDSVLQFAAVSKQYWRITIGHGLSSGLAIGELYGVGTSTQLSRGQIDGSGESEKMITSVVPMQFGAKKTLFFAGPIRAKKLKVQDFTTAQRDELLTLWRAVKGNVLSFLWIESYEATASAAALSEQDCIFGKLASAEYQWSWTDYLLTQPDELLIEQDGRERGS